MNDRTTELEWTIGDGEYSVRVGRVWTRNGERLRIERSDGTAAVNLDAIELESVTAEGLDLNRLLSRDR